MKGRKKVVFSLIAAALLTLLVFSGTALAVWPSSGSSGDQYGTVNSAMIGFAALEGIDPDTFIAIYNAAATGQLFAENSTGSVQWLAASFPFRHVLAALSGPLANQFTEEQVNATCRVLNDLAPQKAQLTDYDTVYSNLSCGNRLAGAAVTRGKLPTTGIAAIVLAIAGLTGVGALLVYKKKAMKAV